MGRLFGTVLLCVLALFAMPAMAQAPVHIEFGQRLSATASTQGGEFWAFAGLRDTRVQVQLGLPGALGAVTLYDGNGEELAREEGEGMVSLQYTLPADGIYLLGVTSAVQGKEFALAFEGQEPEYTPVVAETDVAAAADLPAPVPLPAPEASTPVPATQTPAPSMASSQAPATPAFVADPAVWGIYARLAGRRSVEVPNIYTLTWNWTRPGEELVEQWLDPTGRVVHSNTLTPTGTPGQLLQRSSYMGGKEWLGKVGQDGRVTYIGQGLLKWPYLVEISPEGAYQMRRTKVDREGNPTSIDKPLKHATWALVPVGDGGD